MAEEKKSVPEETKIEQMPSLPNNVHSDEYRFLNAKMEGPAPMVPDWVESTGVDVADKRSAMVDSEFGTIKGPFEGSYEDNFLPDYMKGV